MAYFVVAFPAKLCAHYMEAPGACTEQASALEGNPQEHQWLLASRAGCQALPEFAIITRLLFLGSRSSGHHTCHILSGDR